MLVGANLRQTFSCFTGSKSIVWVEVAVRMHHISQASTSARRCDPEAHRGLQDDLLYENLTVYETLYYAAMLRLPREMAEADKVARVNAVIAALGIDSCRNTIIGAPGAKPSLKPYCQGLCASEVLGLMLPVVPGSCCFSRYAQCWRPGRYWVCARVCAIINDI